MAWRKHAYLNAAGDRIVCAAHGAQFEIESAAARSGLASVSRCNACPSHHRKRRDSSPERIGPVAAIRYNFVTESQD